MERGEDKRAETRDEGEGLASASYFASYNILQLGTGLRDGIHYSSRYYQQTFHLYQYERNSTRAIDGFSQEI